MADDAGKTEEPTPKRLRDAQKEGQFPRTPDASTWAGIAAATAVIPLAADWTEDRFRELFARIPDVVADPSPARAFAMIAEVPMAIAAGAGPVCVAAAARRAGRRPRRRACTRAARPSSPSSAA